MRVWLSTYRYTALVLALGLAVRAILLPLTAGLDFHVWDVTALATLHGHDVYSSPPLPVDRVGPYAYFPLYLYILLPLRLLSLHTAIPFTILGKLPIVAGDVGVALLLATILRRAGLRESRVALGAALFFLNPLVLYNGAFYGRFDSLPLAFLLLVWQGMDVRATPNTDGSSFETRRSMTEANHLETPDFSPTGMALSLRGDRSVRPSGSTSYPAKRGLQSARSGPDNFANRLSALSISYAIAVALKTFPIFLAPCVLARSNRRDGIRLLLAAIGLPILIALPYLLHNPGRFLYIVFVYDASKGPRQFSWQFLLLRLGLDQRAATIASYLLLALFVAGLLLLIRRLRDPYSYAATALVLFLLLSKVVYEQYLLWPLPFLAVLAVRDRDLLSGVVLTVLSVVGLLANPWLHPFGYSPAPALWLNLALAAALAAYIAAECGMVRKRWLLRLRR